MSRTRNPVSRIDCKNTHGWFARVYRDDWVRGKMFSDGVYGTRDKAERAARTWQRRVDRCLPVVPREPVLKVARFTLRKDKKGRYYDVYLPMPGNGAKPERLKFHFKEIENMEPQARKAHKLVTERNAVLENAYRLSVAAWKRDRTRTMNEILQIWDEIKERES